ncbi:MAG: phosphatidylglycerol lysyltransferase domain-containing protein, partial [Actinomycetia bacterium]|nr:phosphatidylglycerol lysyltransferase domain-containing protein [Actinomycetes bacterium]
RRCAGAGYQIVEAELDDVTWLEIDQVSQQWLTRKARRRPENRLITRSLLRGNRYQRIFLMRDASGRLVHLITLDEIWQDEAVVGYHSNINRSLESSPKNADYAMHAFIIETLQREDVARLSLGLCPEMGLRETDRRANSYLSLGLDLSRRAGRQVYNFDGITQHKEAFCPDQRRPIHVATQNPWPVIDLLGVFQACSLI